MLLQAQDNSKNLLINSQRLERHLSELAEFGKTPNGGVNRVAFSPADRQARIYIIDLMKSAGLKIRMDEAGNIIGRREGLKHNAPVILFGSHLDTVPNGGRYDGSLGVVAAIECIQTLNDNHCTTNHPLEVIVFTDEEGGLSGSRALIGELTENALQEKTFCGLTVEEGIRALGGQPEKISLSKRRKADIKAFLEIHIEQGALLDRKGIPIGIVEGIVGINRWDIEVEGVANHAGTTPMDIRQDALVGAAHLILAVHRIASRKHGNQVATIGRIEAMPGTANVIPGRVVMSLEIRDLSSEKIQKIFKAIQKEAESIAGKTGTSIDFTPLDMTAIPALTDARIRKAIQRACKTYDYKYLRMPSGAGHDAQNLARLVPTGMIFIPSVKGISHAPEEFSRVEHITQGVNVLLTTILHIDGMVL